MPLLEIQDPQGDEISKLLNKAGFTMQEDLRIGKHMQLNIQANNESEAHSMVNDMCNYLLASPVSEGYEYTINAD